MTRLPSKSPFVLLAIGLWILACPSCDSDDLNALNQRIYKLFEEGKYQEAIHLAEKAVEIARRLRGPEHPDTATSLNNLAVLYQLWASTPKPNRSTRERSGSYGRSWEKIPTRRLA